MRKLVSLILVVLLLLAVPLTAFAAPDPVTDNAGLLTESQDRELSSLLGKPGIGTLCVVTLKSFDDEAVQHYDGENIEDYAERWAKNAGVGVVFMISMEEGKWCITAAPEYRPVINDSVIEKIASVCVPHLQAGNYYEAFAIFAKRCTVYLEGFDPSQSQKEGNGIFGRILICLVIGLAAGGITAGIMAGKNKSVMAKRNATSYVRRDSMVLKASRDIFLYHNIVKVPKPQNNSSSGGSSSGGARSTRSGSF